VRTLGLILLAALAATALGCQESGFDERKETARPLKVQHVKGESKVPGQAECPATLTVDSLDDTLALGVRPVRAAVPGGEAPAYLREAAAGVELMPLLRRADLPALETAEPDLIIGGQARDARFFEGLSEIAPTVITEAGGGQWKLNVRLVGEALGRTNDAEALLTDYDRRVAGVRRAVGRQAPRVAVARAGADGLRFASRDSFAGTVLADVGVTQVERRGRRVEVTLLSAPPGGSPAGLQGRLERVDGATWWGPGGMLAARAALADLRRVLRE
jgi:iron complex transport system substrate-binding protein